MEIGLNLSSDLNGTKESKYMRDVRDIDELNGVWNVKIDAREGENEIFLSGVFKGNKFEELSIAIIDIPKRKVIFDFLDHGIQIIKDSRVAYDIKVIIGESDYVEKMSDEILNNIPTTFF